MSSRQLSPAQLNYLTARAALDVVEADCAAAHPTPADSATDAEFDAWTEIRGAYEVNAGLFAAERALAVATDALIAWLVASVLPVATADQAESLHIVAKSNRLTHRRKMVDMAMRFAA